MPSIKPVKRYALVDCDNFYVSCERAFQPRLQNCPVIVLSNNDGCIVARSKEVKAFGVSRGQPLFKAKGILEQNKVTIFSSNYTLYDNMSNRVMDTLRDLVNEVDVYSIDEAFVTLSPGDGWEFGRTIKDKIWYRTGLPVTVGIGVTKTLAKAATEIAKKETKYNHVLDLSSHPNSDSILDSIDVQDVWGIGARIAEWLYSKNINTALDLKHIRDEIMRKRTGITGLRVVHELRGIPCIELRSMSAPRKGIISSRSFGRAVTSVNDLKESVATHATIAAEKLRADGTVAGVLSSFITTNTYSNTPQYAGTTKIDVHPATNATCELVKLAIETVDRIFKPGYRYIKAGVMLGKITPAGERQIDLFALRDVNREERLYREIDRMNKLYGSGTIRPLACGIKQPWKMKRDFNSPHYTTDWDTLLKVKAR